MGYESMLARDIKSKRYKKKREAQRNEKEVTKKRTYRETEKGGTRE